MNAHDLKGIEIRVRQLNARAEEIRLVLTDAFGRESKAAQFAANVALTSADLATELCTMQSEGKPRVTPEQHNAFPRGRYGKGGV